MGTMSFAVLVLVCGMVVRAQQNAPLANSEMGNETVSAVTSNTNTPARTQSDSIIIITTPSSSTTNSSTSTSSTNDTTTTIVTPTPTNPPTTNPTSTAGPNIPPLGHPGEWTIINSSNFTCFRMKMAAEFIFNDVKGINIPPNATVLNPECTTDNQTQKLSLTWQSEDNNYIATFKFLYNRTDEEKVFLNDLTLHKNAKTVARLPEKEDHDLLVAHHGHSYKCDTEQTIEMTDNFTVTWAHVQVQSFMTSSDFGQADECPDDSTTNDIVPIAVGCALGGLVIIVLIAYLVGRRISRKKGYQSV